MRKTMVAVLAATMLWACGGDSPTGNVNENGDFAVTVGSGTKPSYSWPSGQGFSVSVVRTAAPGTIVWGVADPTRTMPSPVTHGTVPQGKLESASTERTLTAGVSYRVSVTLADGKTGWKDFTP